MKVVSSRLGSLVGIFTVTAGLMAAACTAAPAGPIGAADQDQTEKKDNKLPQNTAQSTSPTNPSNPSATPSDPSQPSPSTPTPTPNSDAGTTPTPTPTDPGQCAASADFGACFDCCDQANPNGMQVELEAWDTCACQTPGVCAAACGNNYCAGNAPTAACEQCLDNNTAQCDQIAEQACNGNAACAAAFACVEAAQCFDKP